MSDYAIIRALERHDKRERNRQASIVLVLGVIALLQIITLIIK